MRVLSFEGTPYEIGQAFGESCRAGIHELYEKRLRNALAQAKAYGGVVLDEAAILAISERCLPLVELYAPAGYEELTGIARGAGLDLLRIWAMNALTDLRDVAAFNDPARWREVAPPPDGEGCSAFLLQADRSADGAGYCGQTWDLATDNMPHVLVVRRRPLGAPATTCLTTDGCLSLIGMNEHGVAIGTTNIRTTDAQLGVSYLDIIHEGLATRSLEDAVARVREAPRAGAHFYYGMDATGAAAAVECTALRSHRIDVPRGSYVHCNHVLIDEHQGLQAKGPLESSHHRQGRLSALLEAPRLLSPTDLRAFLADHDGDPNGICRHDSGGISSNASVILCPSQRRFFAVHGPACQGNWIELEV